MKSIIVTGASSGIGKVSAVMLANAGYRVYGLARNYSKLAKVGTQLPSDRYIPLEFDITMPETFDRIISEIARGGQIFGLVNNAGYVEPGAIEDLAMSDLRAQFETNFFGLVGMTKQVLPFMLAQGEGRIVNISSMAGLVSLPLVGAYCATKHALEAVSEALCMELWNTGVRVISINPGVIDTNIHAITSGKVSVHKDSRFSGAYRKYLEEEPKGLPARKAGEAVVDAITSAKPRTRYLVGSMKEKAGVKLRPLIPDSLFYSQVSKRALQ